MAHILVMPRQGNTVESCIITNWKVKEGDAVTADTAVCEVETDKAAFEVPAGAGGTVLKLLYDSGDDVPVLKPIAVIGAAGENWSAALGDTGTSEKIKGGGSPPRSEAVASQGLASGFSATPLPGGSAPKPPEASAASAPPCEVNGSAAISPRARNLAAKEALPAEGLSGSGPGGRIIERDVVAALLERPPLTAAAKAAGPGAVPQAGSGLGGRVTAADLASGGVPVSGATAAGKVPPAGVPAPDFGEGAITETPLKGVRKIIADRMFKSLAESAQFTLSAGASVVKLQEIRARIKAAGDFASETGLSKITVNDLVMFAVSRTLPRFPFMNAHKIGDTIKTFERVHLACAVDTPRGLMVPVIRNANLLSLAQISSEAKRLAAACQGGSANPDELSGSTFTVSNLGSQGITGFTPVLNAPEVAILGVCGIEMKPVALPPDEADEGGCGVYFEPHIGFSLTINHQAVDGAPAARFLKALCEAVANIDLLLAAG